MPRCGNSPGRKSCDIGSFAPRIPPTTRPSRTIGDSAGRSPMARPVASGNWPSGNRVYVRPVINPWTMARRFMCIMWFPSNTEAQRTSPISGWCITCVTVRFTAARLLEYVDCLSRVLGDQYARFCGEGVVAISSPYPTTYTICGVSSHVPARRARYKT
jgi:hypothetical protein